MITYAQFCPSGCDARSAEAGYLASALPQALALQTACLTRSEAVLEWLGTSGGAL